MIPPPTPNKPAKIPEKIPVINKRIKKFNSSKCILIAISKLM